MILVLFYALSAFGTGCEPYHHGRVGVAVDIHSKDHHDDHHDDDHHDKDRHDDDQH